MICLQCKKEFVAREDGSSFCWECMPLMPNYTLISHLESIARILNIKYDKITGTNEYYTGVKDGLDAAIILVEDTIKAFGELK